MNHRAIALLLASSSVGACAQLGQDEHSAHHPPGAARQDGMGPPAAMPGAGDRFGEQMGRMQDMHRRMQAAATPAERQALMDEHMRLMQSGTDMMRQMGPMGGGASPGPMAGSTGPASGAMVMPGNPPPGMAAGGMGAMMDMHAAMQRRRAMMEMMMQMMVDREVAMPGK